MEYTITLDSSPDHGEEKHDHDYCSVVLVKEGEGVYLAGRTIFTYCQDSLFIIPPSVLHMSNQTSPGFRRYILRFPSSLLSALGTESTNFFPYFDNARHLRLDGEQSARVREMLRLAAKDRLPGRFGADVTCHIAFVQLLLLLCGYINAARPCETPSAAAENKISPILQYIQAHIAEPFSLNDMATGLFMSKYHLCRLFKRHTGFTLGDYVLRSRLHRARKLLHGGCSVQRAAEESGFGNYAHFIRAFRRQEGISPGRYARQQG